MVCGPFEVFLYKRTKVDEEEPEKSMVASTRARGRVASLSGRHRRLLGEIDHPILSATLLRSRMSSQSRYGTRSGGSAPGRLASEATLTKYGQAKHAEATAALEGV